MLFPSIFRENLVDDFFGNPFAFDHASANAMKTDVKETEQGYQLMIDLPGVKKEDIHAELKDGYLTVSAEKKLEENEKDDNGRYIRRERYTGSQSRSFYVGEGIHEDDIHASSQDGILRLDVPKQPAEQVEDKRHFVQISD